MIDFSIQFRRNNFILEPLETGNSWVEGTVSEQLSPQTIKTYSFEGRIVPAPVIIGYSIGYSRLEGHCIAIERITDTEIRWRI